MFVANFLKTMIICMHIISVVSTSVVADRCCTCHYIVLLVVRIYFLENKDYLRVY